MTSNIRLAPTMFGAMDEKDKNDQVKGNSVDYRSETGDLLSSQKDDNRGSFTAMTKGEKSQTTVVNFFDSATQGNALTTHHAQDEIGRVSDNTLKEIANMQAN